jgi:predicted CopG family antitoxin
MRVMTTIYLDDEQYKWFKKHKKVSASELIRNLLKNYIKRHK